MKNTFYKVMMLFVILALGSSACANQQAPTSDPDTVEAAPTNGIVAEGHLKPARAVNLAFQVPGVVESVVVGRTDPVLGQSIHAIVVASDPALTERDVIRHCARSRGLPLKVIASALSPWTG